MRVRAFDNPRMVCGEANHVLDARRPQAMPAPDAGERFAASNTLVKVGDGFRVSTESLLRMPHATDSPERRQRAVVRLVRPIMEMPRYVCVLTVRDFSAFACWATSVTMRPAKSVCPNCGSQSR